ncbi:hypothetical protein CYVG_00246 [Cyanophage S-SSM6a]|uniref:Uncharacterized protein n=1 Tax=Synechococcus phage S-SSM7 TaxID=445686 RepID=E3SKY5_9CAUD|nr:hypothetical protein SSSM7_067 [Synechococcus phage S-SSM7]ADO98133.1 hypothetical protein SSSM7_067 [Synechococcus phage S-SSM7]AGH07689.1 hypothetical protein CYVG_00246 [Cyanophage S-SSM6a]|tara:strand:+ start:806 stop:1078 length:273 start_codon:yes stop_codon:yes gene_type:complete
MNFAMRELEYLLECLNYHYAENSDNKRQYMALNCELCYRLDRELKQQIEVAKLQGRDPNGMQVVSVDPDPYGLESITEGDYDSEGNWIHE